MFDINTFFLDPHVVYDFYGVDCNCFKLNDVVYEAIENPDDGYRSYLETIVVRDSELLDTSVFSFIPFAKVRVQVSDVYNFEGYDLVDVDSGHVWLRVGTDDYDNYYPGFVFYYSVPK